MLPKIVDHDARRRDFIEAAYETILEEGLAGTTIRAVAKRAGYTTGALVHYFADKEELIRHVLEENGKAVRERMLKAEQTLRGRPALRQVLLEALPTDKRSGSSWKIWLALWYHSEASEAMRKEERRRYREWLGRISAILEQCVELGELPRDFDVETNARLLVATVDGLGVQYLLANGRITASRITDLIETQIANVFR
jgi:AcrR family transcriptional regulator